MTEANILKFCSSCAYAAAATVFYKKDFAEPVVPIAASLSVLGLLTDQLCTYPVLAGSGCILACGTLLYYSFVNLEWVRKAAKMDFFIVFLLAILDVRFGLITNIVRFGLMANIPYWDNLRIFATSVPQFIRRPSWLKAKLQDLRSKLGPMFVLFVASYAADVGAMETSTLVYFLTRLAAGSAILAGVFFRPDNSTMLSLCASLTNVPHKEDFIPYKTSLIQRRNVHRRLMVTSFVCCALVFGRKVWYNFS